MSDLIFSFTIIFPMFFVIAVGYFLSVVKIFDTAFLEKANVICFKIFLPTYLFYNIYQSDLSTAFNFSLILYALVTVTLLTVFLFLIIPILVKQVNRRGVVIQALFRSNYIIIGLPICKELFGAEGMSLAAALSAFVIPLFNVLAIIALSIYDKENVTTPGGVYRKILSNPLIIACALGFIAVLTGLKLPDVLDKPISYISTIASPLTLLALGGTFKFKDSIKNIRILTFVTVGRLLLIPLIMLSIAVVLGYRGMTLSVLLALYAAPVASSSYTMTYMANGDGELAGQVVVSTTAFSMITLFLFVYLGKVLSLL